MVKAAITCFLSVIGLCAPIALQAQSADMVAPAASAVESAKIDKIMAEAQFAGTVLIAKGDQIVFEKAYGMVEPGGTTPHGLGKMWRWASVSKQIASTIAMQEVAAGRLGLDTPIRQYLPDSRAPYADQITPRMLMQHISGLPYTGDGPMVVDGWPLFYRAPLDSADTGVAYCEGPIAKAPPSDFLYGDCDFIMLGAVLQSVTGKSFAALVDERIAKPLGSSTIGVFPAQTQPVPGFDGDAPESTAFRVENFGTAGAVFGTTHDLLAFDRALMTGKLIPDAERGIMWTGEPRFGYAALGQWAFTSPIAGCDGDGVQIIERRGFIGGIVLRNIILPDLDMVLIMTSNRSGAEAAFAEIWQQSGITYDVLAASACPTPYPMPKRILD